MQHRRFATTPSSPQGQTPGDGACSASQGGDPGSSIALRLEREPDAQSADDARALREGIGAQVTSMRALAADWGLGKSGARVELLLDRPGEPLVLQIDHDGAQPARRADRAAGGRGVPGGFDTAESRVDAMGGEAQVDRSESGGTTVVVRLPWKRVSGIARGGSRGAAGSTDAPV